MKKYIIGAALALFVSGSALPVLAQTTGCPAGVSSVSVREGETLWKYKGDAWPVLYQLNPNLDQPWRKFTTKAGGPGVRLVIGETVCGVTRDYTGAIVPQGSVAGQTSPSNVGYFFQEHPIASGIGGLLATLALAFLALCVLVAIARRKDPITSGYPVVPGGVPNVEAATEQFSTRVAARHPNRPFRILSLVEGTGTGDLMVSYSNGKGQRHEPRRMNGERIYQALVRFDDDGSEEQLLMLQRCGNDLWGHAGLLRYVPSQNFVFTPAQVEVAPAATTEAAPLPAIAEQIVPPPAANEEAVAEAPVAERVEPTFACMAAYGDKPPMVRFDNTKVNVTIEGAMTTIRFIDGSTPKEDSAPAEAPAERVAS